MLGSTEEARDVAQETFVRFWQTRNELRAPEAAVAWIYRTATHLAIDCLRARKQGSDPENLVGTAASPEETSHARRLLERLSQTLSPNELEVAVLLRVDEMNQLEAAKVLGVSERTVRRLVQQLDASLARLANEKEAQA
jgi:RNA polymerase sigma-70 factor (ECF subfamily)